MDWVIPFITILGVFIANAALIIPLFLWNRAESRADSRHSDNKLESTRELVRAIHIEGQNMRENMRVEGQNMRDESKNIIFAIQQEMKDFHSRLISLEERKKGI